MGKNLEQSGLRSVDPSRGPTISICANATTSQCTDVVLKDFLNDIRNGKYAEQIERIRTSTDEAERKRLKKQLPGACMSGRFAKRNGEGLLERSGYICADLDKIEDPEEWRESFAPDPHVGAAFVSPSGNGLKLVIRIDLERPHEACWADVNTYIKTNYSHEIDVQCKDVSRLCFVSSDPEMYIAEFSDVAVLKGIMPEEMADKRKDTATPLAPSPSGEPLDKIRSALFSIKDRPEYYLWLKICSAVWAELGPSGTALLQGWMPEEEPGEYEYKFDHRLHDISIRTLYHYAREQGWQWGDANGDKRKATSPFNGQRGGRPQGDYTGAARGFCEWMGGADTIKCYRAEWYLFDECSGWQTLPCDDMTAMCGKYLQQHGDSFHVGNTTHSCRETLHNVKSATHLPSAIEVPAIREDGEWLSRPSLMSFRNGVVDIEAAVAGKAEIIPMSPQVFTTRRCEYDYDPSADCPLYMRFLAGVLPEAEQREALQRTFGLMLTTDMSYNTISVWYGPAGTGKSTMAEVLRNIVGAENCCSVQLTNYAKTFSNEPLTRNLVNIVGDGHTEAIDGGTLRSVEGILKDTADGGTIDVQRKYSDPFTAKVTAKLLLLTNNLPHFSDKSSGIWDRLRILHFGVVFRGTDQQDRMLPAKLKRESSGILNWAIEGLRDLRQYECMPETDTGERLKAEHRLSCDPVGAFLKESVIELASGSMGSQKLYDDYRDYCEANGNRPCSQQNFKREVERMFPSAENRRVWEGDKQVRAWVGIGPKTDDPF